MHVQLSRGGHENLEYRRYALAAFDGWAVSRRLYRSRAWYGALMADCVAGQAKYFFPGHNTGFSQFFDPGDLPALIEAEFLSQWSTSPTYSIGALYTYTNSGMPALGADVSWSYGGDSDTWALGAVVMCEGDPVSGGSAGLDALQTVVAEQAAAVANLQTQVSAITPWVAASGAGGNITTEIQLEYFGLALGFIVTVWLADRVRRFFWRSGGDHV